MYDDQDIAPEKRSSLVPILTIVTGVLAIAVGVLVVLYFLGVFDENSSTSSLTTDEPVSLEPDFDTGSQSTFSDAGSEGQSTEVPKAVVSVAPPIQGEVPVRSTHGDWQVRCDTPAGAQSEQCVLMQFVTAEDRENVGLTVIVLKTADKQSRIMRVLAPLGVLLPSGLGLRIDDNDMGRAGFVRCLPNGCVAEVILEDQLLTQLQSGATATFIIFQTPEEGIGIPISLSGFGPGYAALP
jgi:invasion protein IalB